MSTHRTVISSKGQVIIPAGQSSGSVILTALVDNVKDNNEKAIMTLQPGLGYDFGTSGKGKKKKAKAPSATVTVTN